MVERMDLDIHNEERKYNAMKEKALRLPESINKEIVKKYIQWHDYAIEQKDISYSASKRSLKFAIDLSDLFHPDVRKVTQPQFEKWFAEQMERPATRRTSIGTYVNTGKKLGKASLIKIINQSEKFFKFAYFLETNRPITLFNSRRCPTPIQTQYVYVNDKKKKQYEKPRVTQEQVKELIDHFLTKGTYLDELIAVLISVLNDAGLRFSEAVTLLNKDVSIEDGFIILTLRESKTRTRTLPLLLCKPYLLHWMSKSPNKNKPNALLFCNKDGKKVTYSDLRKRFKDVITAKSIEWKDYSAWHYFRHLTASRFSEWDGDLISYWMGWSMKNRMRERYSSFNYKSCMSQYVKTLKKENNPMLNEPLTELEKQEKNKELSLNEKVSALEKILSKFVKSQEELESKLEAQII